MWAVVNGKEIHRDEVEKYFRTRVSAEGPAPSQEEALSLKLNILDELINNEILLERASKLNLIASDAEVEDKFTESKSPYTEEEFQKKLKDSGLTVEDLKGDIRRQLSVQKLLNREVVAKISITDQDVLDFYNKNRAQFNVAEPQYHIAQIVVTPHPDPAVHNRKNDKATTEPEAKRKIALIQRGSRAALISRNWRWIIPKTPRPRPAAIWVRAGVGSESVRPGAEEDSDVHAAGRRDAADRR